MRNVRVIGSVLLLFRAVPALAQEAPAFYPEAQGERIANKSAVADRGAAMQALAAELAGRAPSLDKARSFIVEVPLAELRAIEAAKDDEGRLKVGLVEAIDQLISFAPLGGPAFGALKRQAGGSWIWAGVVEAPGAAALRLHFSHFDLPENAKLWIHDGAGQAYGPFDGRGPLDDRELWTPTLYGDSVRLQLEWGEGATRRDLAGTQLLLASAGIITERFEMARRELAGKAFCPDNADCVVGAACVSESAVSVARDAVAHMLFASGGYYYICSGGLLVDTDASTTIPYFLTANHCISRASEASSLETYFDYTTTCSPSSCPQPYGSPRQPDTLGATILSTNRTADYTLMRLAQAPEVNVSTVGYLGWNSTPVANTNGATLHRISHPSGSPQAYSKHSVSTSAPTCRSWPRGSWIYSRDVTGATEGGSSGSPVLNASGQVVGQLSGACGTNLNDNCDSTNNATVDGAFAAYFSSVSQYLNPGTSTCTPTGQSCTTGTECCSGSCKGKPGAKKCS